MERKLTRHHLLFALVLVGVSILALQHGTNSIYAMLTHSVRASSMAAATQVLIVEHSISNATAFLSEPFQNDQGDELKLDELIGNLQIRATIYQISRIPMKGTNKATLIPKANPTSPTIST